MRGLFFILIFSFITSCQRKSDLKDTAFVSYDKGLIGSYTIAGFNSGVSLELKPNGKFLYKNSLWDCFGGGTVTRIRGNFSVDRHKLILDPMSLIETKYFDFASKDLKKDSVTYSVDSFYLKKEYHILKWDSLRYLLSDEYYSNSGYQTDDNDIERFADYYNAGSEPKKSGSYFVKRENSYSPKSVLDASVLPLNYRKRFLSKPIDAQIIDVSEVEEEFEELTFDFVENEKDSIHKVKANRAIKKRMRKLYRLNKGSEDGVMERMVFYGNDGCCTIRITEVADNISFGKIHLCYDHQADCGEGDEVTTYLERGYGKFINTR